MLSGGHLDINSIQFSSDSLKEGLKQTMLNQELVFMGQVFELHRLYRAQTAMGEDIKRKGLDNYSAYIRGLNISPENLNNQVKSFMSAIQCTSPGFKQNPLDLQLSADEFIRQSANGADGGSSTGSKNRNTTVIDLNLSPSSGEETSKKGEHRSWTGKRAFVPPPEIIDLEDPNLIVSNYDVKEKNVFRRSVIGDKHNSQSFSKSRVRRVTNGATSSRAFINVDQTVQRQTSYNSGLNKDFLASDTPILRNKPMMPDLNTMQLDDLSVLSNAKTGVFNSLAGTVLPSSGRELNVNNCAETPDILVQNNLKSGNKFSIEKNKSEDNRGKIIYIDLDSDSDSVEELRSSGPDPKIESVGSSSKLSDELLCGSEVGEAVETELGLEKDPKPFCQNVLVTESLDLNALCSKSKTDSGEPSSKLLNGLLCGFEMGGAVGPELGVEKDPKPFSQNVSVTESLDLNTLCSKSNIESRGSSSKLSKGLLGGVETGGAVGPELGVEKDPKPFCKNVLVTESLDLNTLCSKNKIERGGSSSKPSNGLLGGFETGGAVGPELGVEKDPKPLCQNVLVTKSLDLNTLCSKNKIESGGSSSKPSNGLLGGFETGGAVGPELGVEKDPIPFCQNVLVTESLDLNTLSSKNKIEGGGSSSKPSNGLLGGFETGGAVCPELGMEKDPKPFCQNVLVTESLDLNTLCSKNKIESGGSLSKPSNGLLFGFEMGGAVGLEKDPKPLCQDVLVTESLDSNTLCAKSKIGSGGSSSKLSNGLLCGSEMGEAVVPKLGLEKDQKPFCQNAMLTESIDSNSFWSKSKELEVDETDQKAAELLVQLSRERPVCHVGYVTKLDSGISRVQKKEHDRPQRSLDSYEEMVLNAKECGPEDYCVSSNAFVVDLSETDSRYKLKRGTRMKDFQKDILSSLSTLSRHEIREDVNIFEGVLRSREYKRMRAHMADESDWSTPRKSRRSRISRR